MAPRWETINRRSTKGEYWTPSPTSRLCISAALRRDSVPWIVRRMQVRESGTRAAAFRHSHVLARLRPRLLAYSPLLIPLHPSPSGMRVPYARRSRTPQGTADQVWVLESQPCFPPLRQRRAAIRYPGSSVQGKFWEPGTRAAAPPTLSPHSPSRAFTCSPIPLSSPHTPSPFTSTLHPLVYASHTHRVSCRAFVEDFPEKVLGGLRDELWPAGMPVDGNDNTKANPPWTAVE